MVLEKGQRVILLPGKQETQQFTTSLPSESKARMPLSVSKTGSHYLPQTDLELAVLPRTRITDRSPAQINTFFLINTSHWILWTISKRNSSDCQVLRYMPMIHAIRRIMSSRPVWAGHRKNVSQEGAGENEGEKRTEWASTCMCTQISSGNKMT